MALIHPTFSTHNSFGLLQKSKHHIFVVCKVKVRHDFDGHQFGRKERYLSPHIMTRIPIYLFRQKKRGQIKCFLILKIYDANSTSITIDFDQVDIFTSEITLSLIQSYLQSHHKFAMQQSLLIWIQNIPIFFLKLKMDNTSFIYTFE